MSNFLIWQNDDRTVIYADLEPGCAVIELGGQWPSLLIMPASSLPDVASATGVRPAERDEVCRMLSQEWMHALNCMTGLLNNGAYLKRLAVIKEKYGTPLPPAPIRLMGYWDWELLQPIV